MQSLSCTACTYLNSPSLTRCEICNTPLARAMAPPAPAAAAPRLDHAALVSLLEVLRSHVPAPSTAVIASPSSPSVDAGPEERTLESLLQLTDLRRLERVTVGAPVIRALLQQISNARQWWERMEDVYDGYLTPEEQQQVLATVRADVVYQQQGWLDARDFAEALRTASDLAAFLVRCHPDNAHTASALREALDASFARTRSMKELYSDARFFRLRDSWLVFQRRPTVFHASRFYSNWQELQLKTVREELEGGRGSPISGPLSAGGLYCLPQAVPVCRRILLSHIANLRQQRHQPLHVPLVREALLQNRDFKNMLPAFNFISKLQAVMRSVVKLDNVADLDPFADGFSPAGITEAFMDSCIRLSASAFLISPHLLLTNHHVLPCAAAAGYKPIRLCFDDDGDDQHPTRFGQLLPDAFFFTDRELDIAVVAFKYPDAEYASGGAELADPKHRAPLVLRQSATPWHLQDRRIVIVGHPEGDVKQLSMSGHRQDAPGAPSSVMRYNSDTLGGSSGSPILDMQAQLLGVHIGGGSVQSHTLNRGTGASAVFSALLALYDRRRVEQSADSIRDTELLRECLKQDRAAENDVQNRLLL